MAAKFLGIGECMVEFRGSEPGQYKQAFAGDIVNSLRAAHLHGLETHFLTRVGKDFFYDDFKKFLKTYHIQLCESAPSESKNGIYFISNDSEGERTFQYYRSGSAASEMGPTDLSNNADFISGFDIFLVTGITQAISQTCNQLVSALVNHKPKGSLLAYDINYRDKLWSHDDAVEGLRQVSEITDILFFSEGEISVLTDAFGIKETSDYADLLKQIFKKRGFKNIVLKCGDKGSYVFGKDLPEVLFYSEQASEVVDTSGAGDVFNGVFLAQVSKGVDISEAQVEATRAAIKHIASPGAFPASL